MSYSETNKKANTTTMATVTELKEKEKDVELKKKMSTHFKNQAFRLFLLEHAKICKKKWSCKYVYCPEIKTLNNHVSKCEDPSCSVRHCLESQILMSHYQSCPDQDDCEICGPVNDKLRDDYCAGVKRRLTFEDELLSVCAAKKVPRCGP